MLKKNYLLNHNVILLQPIKGYHAGIDAVLLAASIEVSSFKKHQVSPTILDLGAGVGTVGICLLARLPYVQITGIEYHLTTYEILLENLKLNKLTTMQYYPIFVNLLNIKLTKKFDYVLCNPPYYKKNSYTIHNLEQQNNKAYSNSELTATTYDFIHYAWHHLKPKGHLHLIQQASRLQETIEYLAHQAWGNLNLYPITSYHHQPASRFIITAQKNSKSQSIIHSPIVIHQLPDKNYTKIAKNILHHKYSLCQSLYIDYK